MAAPTESRIPNLHRAMNAHIRVRMEGWRQKYSEDKSSRKENTHVFLRPENLAMAG